MSRDRVINSLNAEYGDLVGQEKSIDEAYSQMVATRPRRVLSKHDYNNNGAPFRSARCAENEPKDTDVSSNIYFVLPS